MYHPNLEPPNNECEALDDRQAAVYAESGWLPAPEPEAVSPAHVPTVRYEPVATEPVVSKTKRGTKTSTDKGED